MTEEEFYALKMGNILELEPLCESLGKENVVLQVVEEGKTNIVFEVTYFGVLLGIAIYDILGGWSWETISA